LCSFGASPFITFLTCSLLFALGGLAYNLIAWPIPAKSCVARAIWGFRGTSFRSRFVLRFQPEYYLTYHLFLVFVLQLIKQAIDLLIKLLNMFLPLQVEQVHLGQMSLLQFFQLFLVFHPIIIHLSIFHLLLQLFDFPFESLRLNVLSFTLAFLLPGDCLLSTFYRTYIKSQS